MSDRTKQDPARSAPTRDPLDMVMQLQRTFVLAGGLDRVIM